MTVGDWDRRELCPDGTCTGLIGPEGTCKVCGRAAPNWGEERKRGMTTKADEDDEDLEDDEEYEDEEPDPVKPGTKVEIGEWAERKLCPDGACVGVIGSDGKCKVCGKSAVPGGDDKDDDDEGVDDDEDAVDEYEDEDDEGEDDEGDDGDDEDNDEDEEDDELAAAADQLAGVATPGEVEGLASPPRTSSTDDDEDRQLCPDGACIGVIGANGKCKVCGKEAAA